MNSLLTQRQARTGIFLVLVAGLILFLLFNISAFHRISAANLKSLIYEEDNVLSARQHPVWSCAKPNFEPQAPVLPLTDSIASSLHLEPVKWFSKKSQSVDTNGVAELRELPDLKTFMHYVHANQPFVVRGAVEKMGLTRLWNDEYLKSKLGDQSDNVFHYNAQDAKIETMLFRDLIDKMKSPDGEAYYLAQGNIMWNTKPGNMKALRADLPEFGFDQFLFLKHIQLWFGVGEKKNPIHLDNNENILLQLSGSKRFRVLSPGQREFVYPVVRAARSAVTSDANDITQIDEEKYKCFSKANFIDIEVNGGDLLFLPAYWWHQVQSLGRSLAVNFWYDTHSLVLKQMMKTLDLSVPLKLDDGSYTSQRRW